MCLRWIRCGGLDLVGVSVWVFEFVDTDTSVIFVWMCLCLVLLVWFIPATGFVLLSLFFWDCLDLGFVF